jgi:hypothetical protein
MRRLLSILAVSAACGGAPTPPAQLAPLPDDPKPAAAPAEAKPAQPAPVEAKPAAPPASATPLEIKIPPPQTTVKIVSAGKGKKATVRYTAKPGAKQGIEFAIDFSGKQDSAESVVPTIVLIGEAETKAVDKDGNATYTVTVTGADARAVAGQQIPPEKFDLFKGALGGLAGLTIGGTLGANGTAGEITMKIDRVPAQAAQAIELLRVTLPTLPVLPKEAVGVGAKWQSTTVAKLADRLDVTQTTDYELVAHQGTTWTIKGTTKVTGKDQAIEDSKISQISGTGTSETTIADGALYPTHKSSVETQFTASEKGASAQFVIKVGGAVTPKAL